MTDRHSLEYQQLLDKAFEMLSENPEFIETLIKTGSRPLIHPSGKKDPRRTVLTQAEFMKRLYGIRKKLITGRDR